MRIANRDLEMLAVVGTAVAVLLGRVALLAAAGYLLFPDELLRACGAALALAILTPVNE